MKQDLVLILIILAVAVFIAIAPFLPDITTKIYRKVYPFKCPDCGTFYRRYYDGHDCHCGKISLCSDCANSERHASCEEKFNREYSQLMGEIEAMPDIPCPRCGSADAGGLCADCQRDAHYT